MGSIPTYIDSTAITNLATNNGLLPSVQAPINTTDAERFAQALENLKSQTGFNITDCLRIKGDATLLLNN